MRNRLVVVDEAQTGVVLLDENFPHPNTGESFLCSFTYQMDFNESALFSDTQFLAKHGIVDYSLLTSYL